MLHFRSAGSMIPTHAGNMIVLFNVSYFLHVDYVLSKDPE